jgi:serine/threonine protein phosphatase PrpC
VTRVVVDGLADRPVAELDEAALRGLIRSANAALAEESGRDPRLIGLATTFTGVFCAEDEVRVAHIGDSRAYLVRRRIGSRISHDDSYVQLLVDTGVLDPTEAWQHPQSNLLTQVLAGTSEDAAQVQVIHQHAEVGDRWLLCTDGLTDYVDEPSVLQVLVEAADPDEAADRLIAAALARDAHDNVTVVVCDVVAVEDADPDEPRLAGSALGRSTEPEPELETQPVPEAQAPDAEPVPDAEPGDAEPAPEAEPGDAEPVREAEPSTD